MRTILPKYAVLIPQNAQRVFKGIIYDVYHWEQQLYDGSSTTFEMLKRIDTVKVIAVKDGKVVVLEQSQSGRTAFYDVPGGRHDCDSENELQAIKRELLEETGMTFASWRLLSVVQPNAKVEYFVYIFLAQDCMSEQKPHLDPGEKISVLMADFDKAKELLSSAQSRYYPKEIELSANLQELLKTPTYS